jgi:L-ribulose-5-phosphate 3-epimerase
VKLGIMQGRLVPPEAGRFQSFPRTRWRDEFSLAAAAGLDTIEWIFDAYGEDVNPIGTADGVRELRGLSERHGVSIESVCADWFMDFPLIDPDHGISGIRWQRLAWLMHQGAALRVNRIVVPFVDASAIRTSEQVKTVVDGIHSLGDLIDRTKVELHLETSLSPGEFADLLAHTPHPGVKVNYDSGNSASLGYRPSDEFRAYGARVGSVHLKDRRLGAGTVPLGEGNTDFDGLFESLAKVRYRGDFILQVARGTEGEELEWARKNSLTARRLIQSLTGDRS